jgi:putative N-acetylmannosamine-6-phosphate epimerase
LLKNLEKSSKKMKKIAENWRGGLIVSCQAPANSPLAKPEIIARLPKPPNKTAPSACGLIRRNTFAPSKSL